MIEPEDKDILVLWRRGKNTADIAAIFHVPEHHVANRLPRILHRARDVLRLRPKFVTFGVKAI